jgi:hypothetical protein
MLFLLEFLGQISELLFETSNLFLSFSQTSLHFRFFFAPSRRRRFRLLLLLLLLMDLMLRLQLVVNRPLPGHHHNLLRPLTIAHGRQFFGFLQKIENSNSKMWRQK